MKKETVDKIALVLILFGALNQGFIGAFNINLLTSIIGKLTTVVQVIYILIGLSSIWYVARKMNKI